MLRFGCDGSTDIGTEQRVGLLDLETRPYCDNSLIELDFMITREPVVGGGEKE